MNTYFHPHKVGMVLGGALGLFHTFWSILVALGWAQPFLDSIFTLHMIVPVYQVMPFSLTLALILIVTTSIVGYIIGYVFSMIWNLCHMEKGNGKKK